MIVSDPLWIVAILVGAGLTVLHKENEEKKGANNRKQNDQQVDSAFSGIVQTPDQNGKVGNQAGQKLEGTEEAEGNRYELHFFPIIIP